MKIGNLVIVFLILLAAYGIIIAIAELPPYGMPKNPVHNQVSDRYIHKALEETGAPNMVTAVVLDYRAYDTMFETIVLFTATLAVVLTLKAPRKTKTAAGTTDPCKTVANLTTGDTIIDSSTTDNTIIDSSTIANTITGNPATAATITDTSAVGNAKGESR